MSHAGFFRLLLMGIFDPYVTLIMLLVSLLNWYPRSASLHIKSFCSHYCKVCVGIVPPAPLDPTALGPSKMNLIGFGEGHKSSSVILPLNFEWET